MGAETPTRFIVMLTLTRADARNGTSNTSHTDTYVDTMNSARVDAVTPILIITFTPAHVDKLALTHSAEWILFRIVFLQRFACICARECVHTHTQTNRVNVVLQIPSKSVSLAIC